MVSLSLHDALPISKEDQSLWKTRAVSLARARKVFGARRSTAIDALRAELAGGVDTFLTESGLSQDADLGVVGDYLFEELAAEGTHERGVGAGSGARPASDRC